MHDYYTYITQAGDTWDMLALDMYDDEKCSDLIIEANPEYSDVIVFPSGIELKLPVLDETETVSDNIAPWRR